MTTSGSTATGGQPRTRRERDARRHDMVAAFRRGVPAAKIAETHGVTRQAVYKAVRAWDDLPSIPRDGVRVDAGKEVARTIAAFDQAIADLGEIVGGDAQSHVRLGAITRALDAQERRLKLMASAGYIPRNLAAPLIEQELVSMVRTVADVLRRRGVDEETVRELLNEARERMRSPAGLIEAEAVAA
jgi:Homeodomain-like domain-containing protein